MKSLSACAVVLSALVGCLPATSSSFSLGSSSSGPSRASGVSPDGMITIPDLFGMTREQAESALRRAGFAGPLSDSGSCHSVVKGRVIEIGQICQQRPAPGQVQGARNPVEITTQKENPWAGNIGKPTEWRLMPNVVGMTLDQARAELRRVGFTHDAAIMINWVDRADCPPLTVCSTTPDALSRSGITTEKFLYVGRDPSSPQR
jgi:beta-lactam-binding protein with PASTA domain